VTTPGKWRAVLVCAIFTLCATAAFAQPFAEQTFELNGQVLRYSIRAFGPGANLVEPAAALEPVSALDTAKLLNRFLVAGNIEEAALLSNAPRRRFEVLRDYRASIGEDGFRQVYAEYFLPENRVVAEVSMGNHSLLVWHLRANNRYAGQFYIQIDGKFYVDDRPGATRTALRRLLDAIREGRLPLPIP